MEDSLSFWIMIEEGLYYLCSENKEADQLRSDCAADLHLCFRICKKTGFLITWHLKIIVERISIMHFMPHKFVDDEVRKSKICMMGTTTAQFSLCILAVLSVPI